MRTMPVRSAAALLCGLLLCSASAAPAQDTPAARPNVLLITCDDLNTAVGCYGHPQVQTPNLDRLAANGTRFEHAYAQWPGCLPSRYSFLSGWAAPRMGIRDFSAKSRTANLANAMYLPQWFKTNGYTTVRIDKVFHPSGDDPASWTVSEEPVRLTGGPMLVNWLGIEVQTLGLDGVHTKWLGEEDGYGSPVVEEGRFPEVNGEKGTYYIMHNEIPEDMLFDGNSANRARHYLQEFAQSDEPFFLAVGFRRPHLPFIAQERYFDLYPWEEIILPPDQPGYEKPFSDEVHKKLIRGYYAAVSFVDAQVGKVLETLEETGLAENTIVILFGDHGYCLGERDGWFSKGNLWDLSLRTALLVSYPPSVPKGKVIEDVVELTDLYPTVTDLAGLPRPGVPLDGRSMTDLLRGEAEGWRDTAVSHNFSQGWADMGGSIRDARYRYIENGDGHIELFDLEQDPFCWNNLAADPAHAETRARLAAALKAATAAAQPE